MLKYILLDYRLNEICTVNELPNNTKGIAIYGKYSDNTSKDLQVCDNDYYYLINEFGFKPTKVLSKLKGTS